MITIKSEREIELMRHAGMLVSKMHQFIKPYIKEGITTKELDKLCEDFIRSNDGIPTEKGYEGFPASICASVNDEVVHGIPGSRKLKNGDIITIDTVISYKGYQGDAARTYIVWKPNSVEDQKLVEVTKQSFFEALKYAKKGYRVGDISNAVYEYVTQNGFSILREFQGHGIGREMHEDPGIPNYGKPGRGMRLEPGMTICIEPMVIAGNREILELDDGWTIVSRDGSNGAHYENTILITENEPEILTKP